MAGNELFSMINSLTYKKAYNFEEKDYNPFMVNRFMSFFPDTIIYANEMNICWQLPKKIQYDFYFNIVRSRFRSSEWFKTDKKEAHINNITRYFNVNINRAREMLTFLSEEDLKELNDFYNVGISDNVCRKRRNSNVDTRDDGGSGTE